MGNQTTKNHNTNRNHRPKKNVHWKSAEPPSPPGKPIQAIFDGSAEAIILKWEPPYDGGSPIIGYLLEQRRIGSAEWLKTSATLLPYPEVNLTGIDPTWRFQFRVFAQNVVGMSESSPISDPISMIIQPSGNSAPQFLNELQNMTVLENEPCEFHVSVIGSPPAQINWFKDGFEIFSSRRTKIIDDHGSSTLIFHQVQLTDEGEIKCTATNRYGHVVSRFQLRIDAPPKIRLPRQYEDGYLVEAGEAIKLKVGIAGRPTPAISWSHNSEIINNSARCEITSNDKNSFLKITKATRKDRGEYNVRAINKLGEYNASFLVTVTARPSPPQNIRITMTLGKSVTLAWNEPEDDGGCKIGNYVVEYYREGWDVWLKASSTRQLTATLSDLIEGSEYKFRVKAESPYGLSEPSIESKILFIPDPKRGIITPMSERRTPRTTTSALSPQIQRRNASNENRTIQQIVIPDVPKNVEFISQIYDNEQIVQELNYGTSIDNRSKKRETTAGSSKQKTHLDSSQSMKFNTSNIKAISSDTIPITNKQSIQANDTLSSEQVHSNDNSKLTEPAQDQVHSSNEYMLVLYDDKKVTTTSTAKERDESDRFDLDLQEAIEAPPLSLSTPDLHNIAAHYNPFQPLRRSASSSELLYEKAMQRFYQAVELDEAEMERKRSASVEPNSMKKLRASSEVSDYRSENEFASIGDAKTQMPQENVRNEIEPEIESDQSAHDDDVERDLRKEIIEQSQRTQSHKAREPLPDDVVYEDDYTESTASIGSDSISASVESIEQFINSVRSATNTTNSTAAATNSRQPVNDELETYHPRMEVRALSPYRTPEPGQATVILNKPVPLPDPDIKPKSILKRRTSSESNANELNSTNEEKALPPQSPPSPSPPPQSTPLPSSSPPPPPSPLSKIKSTTTTIPPPTQQQQVQAHPQTPIPTPAPAQLQSNMVQTQSQPSSVVIKPVDTIPKPPKREKEKRSFLNLFSKKTTSTENLKNRPVEPMMNEEKKPMKAVEMEKETKREKFKTRQESFEENKVEQVAVIDHYSDIVREMGSRDSSRPPSRSSSYVPLYMCSHAMREAAARADEEEREYAKQQQQQQQQEQQQYNEQSPYMSNEINKLNVNEDEDAQFMQEVARKMKLYTESNEYDESKASPEVETEAEASMLQRQQSPQLQSDLVEISVEHTKSVSYAVRQIKKPDAIAPNHAVGTVFHANAKSLTESIKLKTDCDGNNSVIDTKRHDTLTKVKSAAARPFDRKSISERRSKSKSPSISGGGGQRKTSLSQTVIKVTRMPIDDTNNDIDIDLPPSHSQSQSQSPTPEPRCKTPEQIQAEVDVETNISSTFSFTVNMMMFVLACWFYLFYDARYAVPFLAVMVFGYLKEIIVNKWHKWTKRKTD